MWRYNKEETIIGATLPLLFWYWCGAYCLIASIPCAYLYARSGAEGEDKFWRRLGVPVVLVALMIACTNKWLTLFGIPLGWASLCIGTGIPDSTDEGSVLGRFWLRLTKNPQMSGWLTKLTIFLLLFISISMWSY